MQHSQSFRSRAFLLSHVRETLDFYYPAAIDPDGGFYHHFLDDGTVYDPETRHLVSSTRFVFNFAMAYRHLGEERWRDVAAHGIQFVRERHRNPETGGYAWLLADDGVIDATNRCHGLAFVLLAYAHAAMVGLPDARAHVDETFALMEQRFWSEDHGLYADEASADWRAASPYRSQNANMHACEALLAAFEATRDRTYLERAYLVARNIAVRQASLTGNLIWEHYAEDWSVDWDYNREASPDALRPWGYQPGHLAEWSRLLLSLRRHGEHLEQDTGWLLPRAEALFDSALERAWDRNFGGIQYGLAPDGSVSDDHKHHWVQAESLAASALLADATQAQRYWDWYERIWSYCWDHFIDHEYGAWYRVLRRDNRKLTNEKSPAGKVDYHNMGACFAALDVVGVD
ncbi:MAG: AGE family epimerase/isomerase [Betaproteobacteria bacterium]|nr:AGE family epimerase/isomerase [Betaproteobacteria bacterium]